MDDLDNLGWQLNNNDNDKSLLPQLTKVFQQTEHINKISIVRSRRQIRRKALLGISPRLNCYAERRRLFIAISNHDVETVEALLKSGVSVNSCDEKLRTPLHVATASADECIDHKVMSNLSPNPFKLKFFRDNRIIPDHCWDAFENPFKNCRYFKVKLLLQHGADTNKKDIIGNTSLHLAACNCNIPIITLLLQHGAGKTLDSMGKNPLQLVFGKLKCLRENSTYSSDRLKLEISHVISLMNAYLKNETPSMMETLNGLSNALNSASLEDEITTVGDLLSDLTNLHINNLSSD